MSALFRWLASPASEWSSIKLTEVALGALVAGGVGYYFHKKKKPLWLVLLAAFGGGYGTLLLTTALNRLTEKASNGALTDGSSSSTSHPIVPIGGGFSVEKNDFDSIGTVTDPGQFSTADFNQTKEDFTDSSSEDDSEGLEGIFA